MSALSELELNSKMQIRRQSLIDGASYFLGFLGVIVLLGWFFHTPIFQRLIPHFVPMNPVTALSFVAFAVALPRVARNGDDLIGCLFAGAAGAASALRLSDYLLHTHFRVDQRLFYSPGGPTASMPNQMAPNTAFCLFVASISLLCFGEAVWLKPVRRVCCLVNVTVAWFAIVGYLLSSTPLYRIGAFTPMAMHSAVGLLALALVILLVGPQERLLPILFGESIGSLIMRVTVPMAFLAPLAVAASEEWGRRSGLYESGVGAALAASLITAIILSILVPMANFVHRFDAERQEIQRRLESHVGVLTDLAAIDALTGILNRRVFDEVLVKHLERSRVGDAPLSLIMLDLDNFKDHNDRMGHQSGDELLRYVGQTLKASIRSDDAAARYGGDEFAVILPGAPSDVAVAIAERIRGAFVRETDLFRGVTSSLGVVTVGPAFDGDIVRAADRCLYEAKNQGKNAVVLCEG